MLIVFVKFGKVKINVTVLLNQTICISLNFHGDLTVIFL